MAIKKHPEWSEKYPAIDGIAGRYDNLTIKPIRSDIEKILNLNDLHFGDWYNERKNATEKLLKQYEVVASIPDLVHAFEERKFGLEGSAFICTPIKVLKEGLDYLEKIKEVREEYRE